MGIKFKVRAADINNAVQVVEIVKPRSVDKTGAAGFLFVVRGETGYVYSSDSQHTARASFPVTDVEGEGPFVYPAESIKSLTSFSEGELSFDVCTDEGSYMIKYSAMDGNAWEERPSFDPRILQTCDKQLEEAQSGCTFSVQLLKEALSQASPFSDASSPERAVHIFDKDLEVDDPKHPGQKIKPCEAGDGTLFSTTGRVAFFFYSDVFKDRHMTISSAHVGLLQSFLSKARGTVEVKTGKNMTFAVDSQGRVFGWTHSNAAAATQKYAYYGLNLDTHIFTVSKTPILSALGHVEKILGSDRDKVKLTYNADTEEFQFHVVEGQGKGQSWPIPVTPDDATKTKHQSFAVSLSAENFTSLFSGCKSNEVMLRVRHMPVDDKNPKEQGMFRSIDEFILDENGKVVGGSGAKVPDGTVSCRVTRFLASMK